MPLMFLPLIMYASWMQCVLQPFRLTAVTLAPAAAPRDVFARVTVR